MTLTEKVHESKQLQFKSKLRLATKSMQVNPVCIELVSATLLKLQKMVDSRASEIEDAMDEQAELKFKATLDVKKKLNLKIAFAQKQGLIDEVNELQGKLKQEIARVEGQHTEQSSVIKK